MGEDRTFTLQAGCVSIGGRGVLIEGEPGTGKSSLALTLIDRGAILVGDDGVLLTARDGHLTASPHPRTAGLLEVRNLGVLEFACNDRAGVSLAIVLDPAAPRFTDKPEMKEIGGVPIPHIRIWPQEYTSAIKVELALSRYGLPS